MRRTRDVRPATVYDTVRTLRAVRRYEARPIAPEIVTRIVQAGRLTASSMNQQPWHFIVVENTETLHALGAAMRTGPYVADAPLAIAVTIENTSQYAISDASRAIQSMLLVAWSEGIGSNWVGFGPMPKVSEILGVPSAMSVLAVLPFGYAAEGSGGVGAKKRKPLGEVASRERYGRPLG